MREKDWGTRAAVVLFKAVLVFLFLNLILYIVIRVRRPPEQTTPWQRYGAELLKAYPGWREEDVKALLTETWSKVAFDYEPFTQFRNKPFRGRFVNIDPAGFRLSKDQAPWPPSPQTTNVFVFGGSTTFGFGLPDDQTIASYLGECGGASGSGRPLAVYNFGRPSYFSSQELILFHQLLIAGFVPNVAVFIDGVNDFHFASGRPLFTARFRDYMAGKSTSSSLDSVPVVYAARWLRGHQTKPQPRTAVNFADPAVLQAVSARWLANKKVIESVANGFGVRTIFVWQPAPVYEYDLRYHFFLHSEKDFGPDLRAKYGYALMDNLRAQGKLGSDALWLADMQQQKQENLYVDEWHYTAPFSKEIAARICNFLREAPAEPRESRNPKAR